MQINIGHLDANGVYSGAFTTLALAGTVRAMVRLVPETLLGLRAKRKRHRADSQCAEPLFTETLFTEIRMQSCEGVFTCYRRRKVALPPLHLHGGCRQVAACDASLCEAGHPWPSTERLL